jgi:hypothetical protein
MTTATVLTPYSYGSAVELGNRMWRKRILPVGDVEYQGRMLHFTKPYLDSLADAFRRRAYDQVSFQLADARNTHTNDPERHRGTITAMDAEPDGLWITLSPTEAGERVLAENPGLGVSARIVENYARSDGVHFDAAVQHVLGTLDPRIPALGSWQAVEMSNGGMLTIDLSNYSWAGDLPPATAVELVAARLGQPAYADDDVDLDAVLAATLPHGYGYDLSDAYGEFGRTFEMANATELARLEQDTRPRSRLAEDRIAAALARIGGGTYTPRAYGFATTGPVTGDLNCGAADEFGHCVERYHSASCGSLASPDIAEARRPQMEQIALRPHLDEDGRGWHDRQFGSRMSLVDHLEAASGVRLGDVWAVRDRPGPPRSCLRAPSCAVR